MKHDGHHLLQLIVADVFELAGQFRRQGETIARSVGETQARWQVLSAASADPKTVPQIARRLGVSRQNVQRIGDLLVRDGAATYEPNPDHRGSPHLVLTAQGRSTLDQITRSAEAYLADMHARLADEHWGALHENLCRLVAVAAQVTPVRDKERQISRSKISRTRK